MVHVEHNHRALSRKISAPVVAFLAQLLLNLLLFSRKFEKT